MIMLTLGSFCWQNVGGRTLSGQRVTAQRSLDGTRGGSLLPREPGNHLALVQCRPAAGLQNWTGVAY